jgi:hypothetical protein
MKSDTAQNVGFIFALLVVGAALFVNAFYTKGCGPNENTMTFKIVQEGNITVSNSTLMFAQLYFDCLKYCYTSTGSSSYCAENCKQIKDFR